MEGEELRGGDVIGDGEASSGEVMEKGTLSPLTGSYLLIVLAEPHSEEDREIILQRLNKGLLSWDVGSSHVDLNCELLNLTNSNPEGDEARNGEKLVQWASENLVVEVLIHSQVNTLQQCMKNLLASFTRHRHIIHAGYTFQGSGSWILQDGTFSLSDCLELWSEGEVQRILAAYKGDISVTMHCASEDGWTTERLSREPFAKLCQIQLNPPDKMSNVHNAGIGAFTEFISKMLIPSPLKEILEPSDIVGNIRFSRPTLYVFPGGQGDAALFGINGFNMLIDGGFSRKSCFWDFTRHLDRLDAVLLTRVNNNSVSGLSSVIQRKVMSQVYPQIGHFFGNLIDRKSSSSSTSSALGGGGEDKKDEKNKEDASGKLLMSLTDEGHRMVESLRNINLKPHLCFRESTIEPINLYHKVGHGKLDLYVLNPAKDSREVKEFLSKWNSDCKSFVSARMSSRQHGESKDFQFPVLNLVSICALLVWQPANPRDPITRILFPGSTPQHKIFEALSKLKHLEFLKYPVCSAKTLAASQKSKIKSEKIISEAKEQLLSKVEEQQKDSSTTRSISKTSSSTVLHHRSSSKASKEDVSSSAKERASSAVARRAVSRSNAALNADSNKTKSESPIQKSTRQIKSSATSRIDTGLSGKAPKVKRATADSTGTKKSPTSPPPSSSGKKLETTIGRVKAKSSESPPQTPPKSAKEANNRRVIEHKSKTAKTDKTTKTGAAAAASTGDIKRKTISTTTTTNKSSIATATTKSPTKKPTAKKAPVSAAPKPIRGVKKTAGATAAVASAAAAVSSAITSSTEDLEAETKIQAETNGSVSAEELLKTEQDGTKKEEEDEGEMATTGAVEDEEEAAAADEPTAVIEDEQPSSLQPGSLPFESGSELSSLDHISVQEDEGQTLSGDERASVVSRDQYETETVHGGADETEHEEDEEEEEYLIVEKEESTTDNVVDERLAKSMGSLDEPSIPEVQHDDDDENIEEKIVKDEQSEVSKEKDVTQEQDDDTSKEKDEPVPQDILEDDHEKKDEGMKKNEEDGKEQPQEEVEDEIKQNALSQLSQQPTTAQDEPADKDIQQLAQSRTVSDTENTEEEPSAEPVEIVAGEKGDASDDAKAADSAADEQEATVAAIAEPEKEEEKAEEAEVGSASEVIQSTATQPEKQEGASEAVPAGQDTAVSDAEESPAVKAPESLTDIQYAPTIEAKELTATQESDGAAISIETKEILSTSTIEKDEQVPDEPQKESTEPTAVESSEIDKTATEGVSAPDAKEESVTDQVVEEIVKDEKTNVESSAPQGAKDDTVPTTDDIDEKENVISQTKEQATDDKLSNEPSEMEEPVTIEASDRADISAEVLSKDEPVTSELSTKDEPTTTDLPTKDEPESAISSTAEAPATSEPSQEIATSELSAQDQLTTTEPSESIESVTKDKPILDDPTDQVHKAELTADSEIPAKDEAKPGEESQPLEPLVREEPSVESAAKTESATDEPTAVQPSTEEKSSVESTTKGDSVTSELGTEIDTKVSADKPICAESAMKESASKEEQTISETVTTADNVTVASSNKDDEPAEEEVAELGIILAGDDTSADGQVKVKATADVTQDMTVMEGSEMTKNEKSVTDTTKESAEESSTDVTKDEPAEEPTADVTRNKPTEESASETTKDEPTTEMSTTETTNEAPVQEKLVTEIKEQQSAVEEPTKIGPTAEQLLASETTLQRAPESLSTDQAEPSEVLKESKLQLIPDITTKEEPEAVAKEAADDKFTATPSEKVESKKVDSSQLSEKSPVASPQPQLVEETIEKVEPTESFAQSEKPAESTKPDTDSKQSDSMPFDEKVAQDSQEISEKATEASQAEVTKAEPMKGTEATQKQIAPSQEDVPKGPQKEEKDETVRVGDVNANSAIDSHVTQDDDENGGTKEEAKITSTVAESALKGEAVGTKTDGDEHDIAEPTATSSTVAPSLLSASGDEKVSCSDATESSLVIDDSAESKIPTDQLASDGINNIVAESMKVLSQPESAISAEQSTLESEVARCIEKKLPSSNNDEETTADKSPLEDKMEETVSQQDQHLGNNQTLPQQDKLDREMEPLRQTIPQDQVPQGSSYEKAGQEKQEDDLAESSQTKDQYSAPSAGAFQQPLAPAVEPLKDDQSGEQICKEITSTRDVEQLKASEQEGDASGQELPLPSTTAEEDESIEKETLSSLTKLDELSALEIPEIPSSSSSLQEEKESSIEKLDDTKGEEDAKTETTPTPQSVTVATVEAASVSFADETTKAAEPAQLSAEKLSTQIETDTEEDEGGKPLEKEPTSRTQSEILKESEKKKSETRDEQTRPTADDKLVAKETEQPMEKKSEAEVCISAMKEPEAKLQSLQEHSIPSGAQNLGKASESKSEEVCGIDAAGKLLPDDSSSAELARQEAETKKIEQTELDETQVQESIESERKKSVSEIKEAAAEVVSTISAAAEEQVARRQSMETKEVDAGLVSQEHKALDDAAKSSSVHVTQTPDQGQADKVKDNAIISIKIPDDTKPADTSADSKSPEPSKDLVEAESINDADSGAVTADKSDECKAEKIYEKPKDLPESSAPENQVSSVQRKESTASVELIKAEESTSEARVTDIQKLGGITTATSEVTAVETTAKEELSVVPKSTTDEEKDKDDSKQSSRSISPAIGFEEKHESKGSSRSVSPGISAGEKPESMGPSGSTSPTPLAEEAAGKDSKGPSGSTSPAPPAEETAGKDSKGPSSSTSPVPTSEGKVEDSKGPSASTSPIPDIATKADRDDSMGLSEKGEHTTETISVVSPKETPSPASPEPALKSSTAFETLSDPKPTESEQLNEESAPEQVPIVDPAKPSCTTSAEPFKEEAEPGEIPGFLADSHISKPEEKSIAEKQADSHDKDIIDSTQAGDEKTVESIPEKEEKADKVESTVPDTNVVSEVINSTTTTTTEVTSKSSDVLISGKTSDITSAGEKSTIKETQLSSAAPVTAATADSNDVTTQSCSSLEQKSTKASEWAPEEAKETTKIPHDTEKQVSSFSFESTTDQVSLSSLTTQTENKLEISKQTTSQLIPSESKSKDYKETSEQISLAAGKQLHSSVLVSTEDAAKPMDSTSQQDILQCKQTIETTAKSSHDPSQDSKPVAEEQSTQPPAEETKEPSSLLALIELDEKVEKTTGLDSSVAVAQNVTQTAGSTAPGEESGAEGVKAHEITSIHTTKLLDAIQKKQPEESLDEKYEDESVEKETKTPAKSTNELGEDKLVTTDALHIQIPGPAAAPPSQVQSTERQEFKAAEPKKTNDEDRVKPADDESKFIRPLPYDETTDSHVDKLLKESQELIDKERKEGTKGVVGIPSAIPSKLPRESREVIRTPDEVADLPVHEEVEPGTYETDELLQEDEEQSEEDMGVDAMGIANIPPAISPVPKTSEEINVTQQLIDTSSSPPNKPEALNEFTAPTKIDAAVSPVLESLLNGQAKKAFPEEATSTATTVTHIQQTAEKTEQEAAEKVSEMKTLMDANQIKLDQSKDEEKDKPLEKPAPLDTSIEKELTDVLIKTVTTSVVITPSTPPVCREAGSEAQFSYTEEKGAWETAEKDSQQQTSPAESEIIHEKKETSEAVEGGGSEKSKVACLGTGSERERTLSTNSDESSTSSATPLTAVSNKEPTEPVRTQDTPPSSKPTEARVESESNEQTEKNEAEKLYLLSSQGDGDKSNIYEGTNSEELSMGAVCSGLLTAATTLSAAVISQSPEEFATKSFPGSGSESPQQQQQQQDQSINKDTLQQALSSAEKVLSLVSTIPTTTDVEKTTNDLNLIGQTSSLSFTETTSDSITIVTSSSNTSSAGPDVPPQPPFSTTNECQVGSESNILESTVSETLATKLLSTITASTTQEEKLDTEQVHICIDTSNEKGEKQDVEKPVSVSTTSHATSSGNIDPAASAVHVISATTTILPSSSQQPDSTSFQTVSVPDNNNDLPNQARHVTLVDITSRRKSSTAEETVAAVEQAEQVVRSVIKETERQVEEKVKVAEELLQEVEEKLVSTAISLTKEQISVHDERPSSQTVLIADKNVGERPKTDEDEEEEESSSVVEKAEGESLEKSIAHSATATTTVTMTTATSHPTSFISNVESNLEQHKSLSPQTSLGKQDEGLFDSATTSTELETTLSSVHSQLTASTISRGDDDDLMTTSGVSTIPDESLLLTSSLTTCGDADSASKKAEAENAETSSSIKSQVKMETSDKSALSSKATRLEQDTFTTEIHSEGLGPACGKESSDKARDESKDKLAATFGDSSTLMEKRTTTQLSTQESSGIEKESHETFTRHISSSGQSEIGKQEGSSQEQFSSTQTTASTITSFSSQMSHSGLEASPSLSSTSTASPSAMTSTKPGSTVTYTTTTITRHYIDGEEVKELRTESEKTTSEIMEHSKEISSSGLSSSPLSSAGAAQVPASMEGDKDFVEISKEREIARTSPGGSYYGVYGLVFGSAAAAEEAEENPTDEESVYGEDSQSHSLPNQSIVTTSSSSSTTTSTVVGVTDTGMTTITRAITGSTASTVTEQQGASSLEEMMSSMRPMASMMGDKFSAFIHTSAASDAMDEGSYSSGDFSDSQLSTMAGAGGRDLDDIDNSTFDSDLPRSSDVENGNLPSITSVGDLLTTSTVMTTSTVTVPVSKEDEKTSSTTSSSTTSFTSEFTSQVSAPSSSSRQKEAEDDKDIVKTWGKPLGLPPVQNEEAAGTTAGASTEDATAAASKGTPKKDKSTDRKNPETPGRAGGHSSTSRGRSHHRSSRNISPIYVDLAYVPHHGNSNYCDSEFFRLCRARYYVFSGLEPSRQTFDGLLQGKQSWDDKNLEVTIIPTYDTDTLGYWVVDSEDALAEARIDLAPSASRCTINLQDHETSCAAYRLEF